MELEPLAITCTSTQCDIGLHCYRQKRASAGRLSGPCRSCGADLVDWDRVHARDLKDVVNTFNVLKTELIRHRYWHIDIDELAMNHARRKGWINLTPDIEKRLRNALAPASPFRDGQQTPVQGRVIYYAQHATATCCRTCLEEWHGIPQGREMTEAEIKYCAELIRLYIAERLPTLTEHGEKIPARRRNRDTSSEAEPSRQLSERQRISAILKVKKRRRSSDDED